MQHGDVVARAAFERHAVDGADERDGDAVVLLGLGALALGGEGPVLLGDALDSPLRLRRRSTSAISLVSSMALKSASSIGGRISIATV